MNKTKIEWVKNPDGTQGYTFNPITGCLNHINGMCKGGGFPCYAYRLANGRLRERYLANHNVAYCYEKGKEIIGPLELVGKCDYSDPFYPRFWEDRLYEPVNKIRRWGRQSQVVHKQEPKGIFVCDMSDLFGDGIPEEWTKKVIDRFQYCPQHRFYLLTKQPQNLIKFSPFPENCWVGGTVTDSASFALACGYLRDIEATVKYLSIEPYLGMIINTELTRSILRMSGVKQVIIGAQTKPYKPPKIEWVQEIVQACDKAGVAVFLKDNLKPLIQTEPYSSMFYSDQGMTLRQEIPEVR